MNAFLYILPIFLLTACSYNGDCELDYNTTVTNRTKSDVLVKCDECYDTSYDTIKPNESIVYHGNPVIGYDKGNGETLIRPRCEAVSIDCVSECTYDIR